MHPSIRSEDWRSPLVKRLLGVAGYCDGEQTFTDFYSLRGNISTTSSIRFYWQGLERDFQRCINTYQDSILTEFAALALACVLIHYRAELEITEVTRRGQRADYWIGDRELMLEVSGQQDGNLEDLFIEKSVQLSSNPFKKAGYVCVSDFTKRQARLGYVGGEA
jgi:hypothetical protein